MSNKKLIKDNIATISPTNIVVNDPELQRIVRLLHSNNIAECEKQIDLYCILDPQNTQALYIKSCCKNAYKQYEQGLAILEKAIKIQPQYAFYIQKISILRELRRYKAALDVCNMLIYKEKNNSRAYLEKSIVYAFTNDLANELIWAQKALEIEKIDLNYNRLIVALVRNNCFQQALELAKLCTNPTKETLNSLATACGQTGNHADALTYLTAAIKLDPRDPVLQLNMSLVYQKSNLVDQAINILKNLLIQYPDFEQAYINLAVCYIGIGYNDQALECADNLLKINPNSWPAYNIKANCHMQLLNCDLARDCLLKSLEINSNQPRAYVDLGSCYEFLHDFDSMKKCWKKVPAEIAQQSNLEIRLELYRTSVDPEKNIYLIDNFAKYAHQTNAKKHQYIKILEFENAQIMQDDWFIMHNNRIYSDLCWQSKVVSTIVANSELGNVKTIRSPDVEHEQPIFFIGGANNYYHWILDYLPRLQVLKENPLYQEMDCLVYSDWTSFQQQTMELLGLANVKKICYHGSNRIKVPQLVVPMTISRALMRNQLPDNWVPRIHSQSLQWLEQVFVHDRGIVQNPQKLIYISRKNAPHRRLHNEQALLDKLQPLGFEVVNLEQMSFEQQINLFANCRMAVGPHGAAFANMAWAGKNFDLVELHGGQVPEFFKNIAGLKKQNWHEIQGHNITADNPNKKFLDFTVDHQTVVDKILSILNK